jgi:purine-nucleoside phosphorylase
MDLNAVADTFLELRKRARSLQPSVALILGSGMGAVTERMRVEAFVPFAAVPQLGTATVQGHRGRITLGVWADRPVLVFEGRLHFYEGHPWPRVVWPAVAAHALGARQWIVTNAAGGIRETFVPGCFMGITDHLEWTRPLCWKQPGSGALGISRPSPYSPRLLTLAAARAAELGIDFHQGKYASVTGPSYETPAEIRALRFWGADAVGMSTAREVQTGHDLGLECLGISLITNPAAGITTQPLNHGEVLATAAAQSQQLAMLLEELVKIL